MTHDERRERVAEAIFRATKSPTCSGILDYHRDLAEAAIAASDATLEITGKLQAHFQHGYASCLCRDDVRPACCMVAYIKAGNQLAPDEVLELANLIEQQAATIARLSAPFDLYQWERHEFAGTAQTFDTVIQERLHGE